MPRCSTVPPKKAKQNESHHQSTMVPTYTTTLGSNQPRYRSHPAAAVASARTQQPAPPPYCGMRALSAAVINLKTKDRNQ